MPGINLVAPYANLVFDSSVKDKSDIFALGGPVMTIHVTANEPGDTGSIALQGTNVPYKQGASDEYMGWQTLGFCSVGTAPKTIATYFAYGRFSYTGKGRLSSAYSDAALSAGDSGGTGGGGSTVDFGTIGLQLAQADTPADASLILQLGTASKLNSGATGSSLIQTATALAARTVLELGSASLLNAGAYGTTVVQMQNAQALKDSLSLGSASTLTYGTKGAEVVQAGTSQEIKDALGLSALASVTPSAHGTDLVTSVNAAASRNLLQLGTASILNHGQTGKDLIESTTQAAAKSALGISFGDTSETFARGDHVHAIYMPLTGGQFTGTVGTSIAPSLATDLVNKQYVDTLLSGFKYKEPVEVATTALIILSGLKTIDGVSVLDGDRVLVKNQTTQEHNGIWIASSGAWVRSTDFDSWSEIPGAMVVVKRGTTYGDTGWICTSNSDGTLNVTAITFVQNFTASGTFVQGAGITIAGNVISLSTDTTMRTGLNAQFLNGVPLGSGQILNQTYPFIPNVAADGGMEVGRYIDFHRDVNGTDKHGRLEISTTAGDSNLYSSGSLIWTNANVAVSLMRLRGLTPSAGAVAFYPDSTSDAQLYTTSTWVRNTFSNVADATAAKTALGLSALATSGSASDLSSGTISDSRLPTRLRPTATTISDANAAISWGAPYRVGVDGLNTPDNTKIWSITVEYAISTTYISQIATEYGVDTSTDLRKYWRAYNNNTGTWSNWVRLRWSEAEQAALWAPISHTHNAYALNEAGVLITDWNTALGSGLVRSAPSTTSNAPNTTSWFIGDIKWAGTGWAIQTAIEFAAVTVNDSQTWQRYLVNGTFTAWTRTRSLQTEQSLLWAPISHTHSYLPLTGGTLTGSLTLSGDPTAALQPATKQYVDTLSAQTSIMVRVASTGNHTMSGLQTIDDVALAAGDRILMKNAPSGSNNGIYVVSSGAWTRASDADTWNKIAGGTVTVVSGTLYANTAFVSDALPNGGTLGTTNISYKMVGQTYVDTLKTKQPVVTIATSNITLSGNQTINGVSLVSGDRVLVKNQTTASQNGIYIVSTSTWTRATDADTWNKILNCCVFSLKGTLYAQTCWFNTNTESSGTLGTTNISFDSLNVLLNSSDITDALGYTPTTQSYVDTEILDLSAKQMCLCATTTNITLSGLQTIDDQSVVAGNRVLVKNQTNAGENGIYVVASGAWTRASDADSLSRLVGAYVSVARGTVNRQSTFVSNTTVSGGTLGVTAVTFKASLPTKAAELGLTDAYFDVKLGYAAGSGGIVTQLTSKSTNVTLDKLCGTVIMNNAALAAGATVSFTLNNSTLAAGDFVIAHHYFAGTLGAYRVDTHSTANGSVVIRVKNESASSLSETIQIRFMALRGVAS